MYDISVFDNFDKLKIDVRSEGLYEKSMLEVRTNDLLFSCLGLVLRVVGAFIKFRSRSGPTFVRFFVWWVFKTLLLVWVDLEQEKRTVWVLFGLLSLNESESSYWQYLIFISEWERKILSTKLLARILSLKIL